MSTDKIDPSKKDTSISSADDLVKTSKSGDVELSEQELSRVTGGTGKQKPVEYLKVKLDEVIITSVS
jgi:hypothetical protein